MLLFVNIVFHLKTRRKISIKLKITQCCINHCQAIQYNRQLRSLLGIHKHLFLSCVQAVQVNWCRPGRIWLISSRGWTHGYFHVCHYLGPLSNSWHVFLLFELRWFDEVNRILHGLLMSRLRNGSYHFSTKSNSHWEYPTCMGLRYVPILGKVSRVVNLRWTNLYFKILRKLERITIPHCKNLLLHKIIKICKLFKLTHIL